MKTPRENRGGSFLKGNDGTVVFDVDTDGASAMNIARQALRHIIDGEHRVGEYFNVDGAEFRVTVVNWIRFLASDTPAELRE